MSGEQILGTVRIHVDGQEVESLPDAELTLDGETRDPIWAGGRWRYRAIPQPGMIKCKIAHTNARTMRSLDLKGALIVFVSDNGVTYHMRDSFLKSPPALNAGDGSYDLEYSGSRVEEQ